MIRAARIFAPISSIRLAIADACVVTAVFFALTHWAVGVDPIIFVVDQDGGTRLAPLIAILLLTMYFSGLYERKHIQSRIFLLQQLGFCAGVGLISQALISYLHDPWTLPRSLALYGLLACIFALFAWRLLRDALLSRMEGTGTVLILGTDQTTHRIVRYIHSHPGQKLTVAGCLTNRPEDAAAPVLGGLSGLRDVAHRVKPDLIISGMVDNRDRMPIEAMVDLCYAGARIEEAGTACELICRYVSARDLRPSRMLFSRDFDKKESPVSVWISDVVVSAVLLILGAPFALLYAVFLRLSDGKPVFINETCLGFQGRPFVCHRLRLKNSGVLSAFARGLNLNEWPQLWNVLLRRMSMVGPRPRRVGIARELSDILPVDEYRQNIRPGITGWARINLEPDILIDAIAEVEYDLYYIRNQSASLYTYILLYGLRSAL